MSKSKKEKYKLKPCPFCGGKAILIEKLYQEAADCGGERIPEFDEFYVECIKCSFARLPHWGNVAYSTIRKAIAGWNNRIKQNQ